MNNLASQGIVEVYSPLMEIEGSYSAQFEHVMLSCFLFLVLWLSLQLILNRLSCWGSRARKWLAVGMTTEAYQLRHKLRLVPTLFSCSALLWFSFRRHPTWLALTCVSSISRTIQHGTLLKLSSTEDTIIWSVFSFHSNSRLIYTIPKLLFSLQVDPFVPSQTIMGLVPVNDN